MIANVRAKCDCHQSKKIKFSKLQPLYKTRELIECIEKNSTSASNKLVKSYVNAIGKALGKCYKSPQLLSPLNREEGKI